MSLRSDTATVSVVLRPLTTEEATRLSEALRETPNILGYLPQELLRFREALVVENESGKAAGICLIKELPQNWSDLAVIFVFPEHRRCGIGSALFAHAFTLLREQKRNILCVSREPSVLRLMEAKKMRFIGSWQLPFSVQMAYSRHYRSLYRFREAFRKSANFPNQPAFRTAILKSEHP